MSSMFNSSTEGGSPKRLELTTAASERAAQAPQGRVDSNAVRWVLAATVAFWLTVFAASRSFLF